MKLNLAKEMAALEQMTVGQLQQRYAEVFGETVRSRHKQYLIRRIAWRLQSRRAAQPTLAPDDAALQPSLSAIRRALRQERAVPLLEQFGQWLHAQQATQGGPLLPKSPMGQAIAYALNQWPALNVYTTDGDLAIDNNASENALRRVAIGRKNWLFCGSDAGGHTAAVLFSLIATCQRRKIEPLAYLRDTLTRIAAQPISRLAELLPGAATPD